MSAVTFPSHYHKLLCYQTFSRFNLYVQGSKQRTEMKLEEIVFWHQVAAQFNETCCNLMPKISEMSIFLVVNKN